MAATGNDEISRLEARIQELEDELSRQRRQRRNEGFRDVDELSRQRRQQRDEEFRDVAPEYRDFKERKIDESARLFRGLVRGTLEAFRVGADSASYFVEDVLERNAPERSESPTDVTRRLPGDVRRAAVRAFDYSLDIPSRAAERFQSSYSEEEGGRTRPRARRSEQRAEQVRRREEARPREAEQAGAREEPRYEEWSKTDLYERAQELDVEGRSEMSKEELVDAVRRREELVDNIMRRRRERES
jgi:hypothetical protein